MKMISTKHQKASTLYLFAKDMFATELYFSVAVIP